MRATQKKRMSWPVIRVEFGIEFLEVVRLVGPSEDAERPQRGREPGIEDVFVLDISVGFVLHFRGKIGAVVTDHDIGIVFAVPDRDAVAPPKLARNAPVAQVVDPVEIGVFPVGGDEAHFLILYCLAEHVFKAGHAHEPLFREIRFDHSFRAVRNANAIFMRLFSDQKADLVHRSDNGNASLLDGHPFEFSCIFIHLTVGRHDIDEGEFVIQPHLIIVGIMRGSDFDGAGAKFRIDESIGDDGDLNARHRLSHHFANEFLIALIIGRNGDRSIPEHRFRPCRSNRDKAALIDKRIAEIPNERVSFFILDLIVRKGRLRDGIPIDEVIAAVNEARIEHFFKHGAHGTVALFIHRKGKARPIAGTADFLQLAQNLRFALLFPFPDVGEELLARKIFSPFAHRRHQVAFDDRLRGDPRMVSPGHPQRLKSRHPFPADKHVLQSIDEGMPHVKDSGDIRRRDRNAVGGLGRRVVRAKKPLFLPECVPLVFNVFGRICLGQLLFVHT